MLVIKAHNVNDAYVNALYQMKLLGAESDSRNGKVMKFPYPVTTRYAYPQERVLFDEKRDANPFFHLFESLWMLGGRNDIAFLEKFNSTIGQFSDDGETMHGAYGYRWREHFKVDQLEAIIGTLTADNTTRRAVLTMWDPYIDPEVAAAGGKDVPCNTQVFFNVRPNGELDMTVTNRSNDMIWGCYGANAVHMSMLHEYVSLVTGLPMGIYYQVSNDLHIYERHFDLLAVPKDEPDPYLTMGAPQPLMTGEETVEMFDRDVMSFLDEPYMPYSYRTEWFNQTVKPMALAHAAFKTKRPEAALELASQIESHDWQKACTEWLQRRIKPKNVFQPKGDQVILTPEAAWPFPIGGKHK